jgi:hypothetical protein
MGLPRTSTDGQPAGPGGRLTVVRPWPLLVLLASAVASADDRSTAIRVRHTDDDPAEPRLHLDATTLDRANAEGGLVDGRSPLFALGPRARFAAEGRWWQTGLAPSTFATDLRVHGWRAGAELSYDLGPFRIGVNASMTRTADGSHRMVGLFAYRTFRLSHWMHAWILLGVAYEQWQVAGVAGKQGVNVGLALGTTFR